MIHSWATEEDDPTEDRQCAQICKPKIEETSLLTKNCMEMMDAAKFTNAGAEKERAEGETNREIA